MMHKINIRFLELKNHNIFELELDERLSFFDNLKLLEDDLNLKIEKIRIYDPNKKVFLNQTIPLTDFNIETYIQLYLFC